MRLLEWEKRYWGGKQKRVRGEYYAGNCFFDVAVDKKCKQSAHTPQVPWEGFFPSLCILVFLAEKAGTLIMRPLIPCEKSGGGFYVCVDGSRPSVFMRLMGATESTFSPYNKRRKGERHKSIRVLSCPTNHLSDTLMPIMSWSYTKNAIAHRRKTIQLGIG